MNPATHFPKHPVLRRLVSSRPAQIGLVSLFWALGCAIAQLTGVPVPGSLVGMLLLLGMLGSGMLEARRVAHGAGWLLTEMLLFFVPAVVALLAHPEFLGLLGVRVLLVILGSTVLVMLTTALTVEWGMRLMSRHARPVAAVE